MLLRAITSLFLFFAGLTASAQVTFVIESLPSATPSSDTIYLCGNFNGWVTRDPSLALQRQLNGQLAITVNLPPGKYEYKFTRGNWMKVETSEENNYIGNRLLEVKGGAQSEMIRVANWLDLGGARPLNYFIFYFFACAFQAVALCLLVYRIPKKDPIKFNAFVALNAVFIFLLILLVFLEIANPIWQTYFAFVFQVGLFCWAPLVLYFANGFGAGKRISKAYLYFLPALVAAILICVRLLNLDQLDFFSDVIWPPLTIANAIFIGAGLLYNIILYSKMYRSLDYLRDRQHDVGEASTVVYYVYWISFFALLLLPLHLVLQVNGFHHPSIDAFHGAAIVLTAIIFLETYYFWKYPEITREERSPTVAMDYPPDLVEKLNSLMLQAKPYKNADLTVSDLADLLGTRSHLLSRVINDHFNKNFRDFVNTYRIEEFIQLASRKEFKHYTFLALAQEVGFNSKSTFNLAFKKLTNQSPREYFKSRGMADEE